MHYHIDEILIPWYTRCCQHNHLPVQSVMKLLSKWQPFLFSVQDCTQAYLAHAQWKICGIHFVKSVLDVHYFLHNYWDYMSSGSKQREHESFSLFIPPTKGSVVSWYHVMLSCTKWLNDIFILHHFFVFNSEVWTIGHHLWLGLETVVYAV